MGKSPICLACGHPHDEATVKSLEANGARLESQFNELAILDALRNNKLIDVCRWAGIGERKLKSMMRKHGIKPFRRGLYHP